MATQDRVEVENFVAQSREFLVRARRYIANGDLHQASEKAWGAAAHMAKAVASAQGWRYDRHSDFSRIIGNVRKITGEDRLLELRSIANELHGHYYERKRHLDAGEIAVEIDRVAELVEILAPLTE